MDRPRANLDSHRLGVLEPLILVPKAFPTRDCLTMRGMPGESKSNITLRAGNSTRLTSRRG